MGMAPAWDRRFLQWLKHLGQERALPFRCRVAKGSEDDRLNLLVDAIIRAAGQAGSGHGSLLVGTQDKALIAAAILAALTGGPKAIIPYAFSIPVLKELGDNHHIKGVLSDELVGLPPGLTALALEPRPGEERGEGPARAVKGQDECFVTLFTGGSTGHPKLWEKTPRNLIGEAVFLADKFSIQADDIILATVGPQHIYGLLFTVLLPLVSGAVVINEIPQFYGEIEAKGKEYGATILVGTPAHYRAMRGRKFTAASLRFAVSSGGFLAKEDSLWFSDQTGVGVTEIYGSTETGGIATRCRGYGEEAWNPFDCLQWRLDKERFWVRSPFLSPSLTCDDAGFYPTGDRVKAVKGGGREGRFILLGRMDGIVKVAGKRVTLNEVEDRIKALADVGDAFVLSLTSPTMRATEIVCLVQSENRMPYAAFREQLQTFLEPYAIPRRVIWVDKIPLTPAGKPDRQAAERLFTNKVS